MTIRTRPPQPRAALRILIVAGLCALSIAAGRPASAQVGPEIRGSCVDFDLSIHVQSEANPAGEGLTAMALYDGVPTYASPAGSEQVGTLMLGEVITIVEDGQLVGTRRIGDPGTTLRYVRRGDLRCENKPLFSENTRLERKAVIRVGTVRTDREYGKTVSAYRTPSLDDCDENCRKLSRFDLYFVMAETDRALLLSREVRIATAANTPMVGWIAKEDVYEWPYSVGLRVREDFTFGDGYGTVCGYLTLEEARQQDPADCQPILGGPSWFETSTRLLVMEQHSLEAAGGDVGQNVIFETVAPITSRTADDVTVDGDQVKIGTTDGSDGSGQYAVDPGDLRGASTDVLLKNNRIDLFFLIDGTKSMEPYIDAIRGANGNDGLIQVMLNGFQREIADGVKFRAGFRVFRDTNRPDRNSIGEGMPLPEQDCSLMTVDDSLANLEAFNAQLSTVSVTTDDRDDFSEDLYGGLEQMLRDIRGCPTNRKLIFVITDAGYDPDVQRERGVAVPDMDRFASRFNEEFEGGAIFFVRPPVNPEIDSDKYNQAYRDVLAEAQIILSRLTLVQEMGDQLPFFFDLTGEISDGAAIVGEITDKAIRQNVNPEVIDDLIIDIRGGASLAEAIERLRAENKDIPGYFWRLVEKGACEDLGEACKNPTYQSVTQVFVVNDPEKIALDVWMDDQQLLDWDDLLKRATSSDKSVAELRVSAVSAIDDAIRTVIREPPFEDENETFGEYLQRAGRLPTGFGTPMLGYSLADLMRPERVSVCELLTLLTWLDASRQMLRIVSQGDALPDVTVTEQPADCPNMTVSGTQIRNPTGTIGERRLERGSLRTTSTDNQLSKPIYWVPQVYLP